VCRILLKGCFLFGQHLSQLQSLCCARGLVSESPVRVRLANTSKYDRSVKRYRIPTISSGERLGS
jgi:hypothetical protein